MRRRMFLSKIHRAVVTDADLNYEGSVTIDGVLLDAAGMLEFEEVHVWNVTRGSRCTTYMLRGEDGSGQVCVNGAAAHLNKPGDTIILASFGELEENEARTHTPTVVRVDPANRIIGNEPETPEPANKAS